MNARILTLVSWALIATAPVVPHMVSKGITGVLAAFAVYAVFSRRLTAFHTIFFFAVFFLAAHVSRMTSQITLSAAIIAYAVVLWKWKRVRPITWWVRGDLNPRAVGLAIGSAAVAGSALLVWYALMKPDVAGIVGRFVPTEYPLVLLIAGGTAFAAVNAFVEEFAYRGVLTAGLKSVGLSAPLVIVLQALAFGTLHIHGFPHGWIGVGLASIYGLMMGAIRESSGGMLAPWIGHLLTDTVIVCILLFLGA